MLRKIFALSFLLIVFVSISSAGDEIAFTHDDRDRIIRLEEGQKGLNLRFDEGQKALNQRFDDQRDDIQDIRNLLYVVISGIFALIAFVLWDRRTAIAPVVKKNKELEEREERLERAFKEFARTNPDAANALKYVGIL